MTFLQLEGFASFGAFPSPEDFMHTPPEANSDLFPDTQIVIKPSGYDGQALALDILPVILEANDKLHERVYATLYNPEHTSKYSRDFRTIHYNTGQRSGMTSAIMKLAKEGDLVIAPDTNWLEGWQDELGNCAAISTTKDRVTNIRCAFWHTHAETVFNNIWIVGAFGHPWTAWSQTDIGLVRSRLIKNGHQRMILIG
ncbi:hypothetical protein [Burkholderia phage BCSR5]|nr:hypothetical protein [Burkholderia phage BCSR5]